MTTGALRNVTVSEFLKTQWEKATTFEKREIAKAIVDFMRDHPNDDLVSCWPSSAQ
jgi:hypothetical protein